jgi:hypothetical protein
MDPTFDLIRLVEDLRAAGFRVDTRQYLTAHHLLFVLAAQEGRHLDKDPEALRTHLGPIFCTSREEQERFGDILRAHLGVRRADAIQPPAREPRPEPPRPNYWKWISTAAALIFVSLGGAALCRYYAEVEVSGRVETVPKSQQPPILKLGPDGTKVELDADGKFLLNFAPADGTQYLHAELKDYDSATALVAANSEEPVVLTLRKPEPPPPTSDLKVGLPRKIAEALPVQPVQSPDWGRATAWAVAVACLVYLAPGLAAWLRRRLALFQYPIDKRPDFTTLVVNDSWVPQLAGSSLRRLAAALRRRRITGELEFDVPASVEGAARNGGLLQSVFVPRRELPEYLALIQRFDLEDHQAHLFEALLDALQLHGVAIERYFFEGDPRVCFSQDDPTRPRRLVELVSRHHRANLLLFSDAETCFNPRTGKLDRWLQTLKALPHRVLFTPAPPAQWTQLEWTLAEEGFDVVPVTEEGLSAYAKSEAAWRLTRLFPAPYARPFPESIRAGGTRWLERYAPPEEGLVLLEGELQDYLGPKGFAWLAACAVYPAIGVPITLDVIQALKSVGSGREVEGDLVGMLAALARLPWFRHGRMPEWLRRHLLTRLTPEQEVAVRHLMFRRLDMLARRTLVARKGEEEKAGLRIAGWVGPVDLLRSASLESPLGDAVFLAFMAGARFESPVLEAPGRLRRLFHRLGWVRLREPALTREPRAWGQRLLARLRTMTLFHPHLFRSAVAVSVSLLTLGVLARTLTTEPSLDGELTAFAFSPDSSRMVVGRRNGVADVLDVTSGQQVAKLTGAAAPFVVATASAEAEQVVTATASGVIHWWSGKTGELRSKMEPDQLMSPVVPGGPAAIELSPDRTKLAILWRDGRAAVMNLAGSDIKWYPRDSDQITALGFEEDETFVTASTDGTLSRWRAGADDPEQVTWIPPPSDGTVDAPARMRFVQTHQGGSLLVEWNGLIVVRSGRTGAPIQTLRFDGGTVVSATVSGDRRWVAAASREGVIRLWSLSSGEKLGDIPQQPGVTALYFAPDGKTLATVRNDDVWLWPLEAMPPLGKFAANTTPPGAQIWVDGNYTGRNTPVSIENPLLLPVGSRKIVFKLNGKESRPQIVIIEEDTVARLINMPIESEEPPPP